MPQEPKPSPPGALLRWGAWFYLALAIAGVVWVGLRDGAIELSLFLSPESWLIDLGIGAAAAALLSGFWQLGALFLPAARRLEGIVAKTIGPLNGAEIVVLAALSGFSEELFFRGAVQEHWGLVPATILFALLHVGPGVEFRMWTLFALIAGGALGALLLWRGTLLAPITAHVLVNLVGLLRIRKTTPEPTPEAA